MVVVFGSFGGSESTRAQVNLVGEVKRKDGKKEKDRSIFGKARGNLKFVPPPTTPFWRGRSNWTFYLS